MKGLFLVALALLAIPVASALCDDYCRDGTAYSDGEYAERSGECVYGTSARCAAGCDERGIGCDVGRRTEQPAPDPAVGATRIVVCEPYCRDGVFYGRGAIDRETGACAYEYRARCEEGCNRPGTECAQTEQEERACPGYCADDIHYYRGDYDAERCVYHAREVCRYGCDLRAGDCADPEEAAETPLVELRRSCSDTDAGRDFARPGRVEWTYGDEEGRLVDHCVGFTLVEYYCEDGVRAAAYKECSEEGMVCRDASCVELEPGECFDPDGDDPATKAWAEGTNAWNDGLIVWGDYCTETTDGAQVDEGAYINEAICLETADGYEEVRYAPPRRCADGCVDGVCLGAVEEVAAPVSERERRAAEGEADAQPGRGRGVVSSLELTEDEAGMRVRLSDGRDADVKVMPETASERALERLRLTACAEGCRIELKEVGDGERRRAVYELRVEKEAKLLGLFRTRMRVEAQVDAETGDVTQRKPWWAFLASE